MYGGATHNLLTTAPPYYYYSYTSELYGVPPIVLRTTIACVALLYLYISLFLGTLHDTPPSSNHYILEVPNQCMFPGQHYTPPTFDHCKWLEVPKTNVVQSRHRGRLQVVTADGLWDILMTSESLL